MKMKKIITTTLTAILTIIIAMFILRCCMASDRSVYSKPAVTDALREAYADGTSVILVHTQTTEISDDGLFAAFNMFYNPESGELQFAVRWNNSTYRSTGKPEGYDFDFVAVNETTGEEYPCTITEGTKRLMYNYRRVTAEGVSLDTGDTLTVRMIVSDHFKSEQVLKYDGQPLKEYKLPRSLSKELIP